MYIAITMVKVSGHFKPLINITYVHYFMHLLSYLMYKLQHYSWVLYHFIVVGEKSCACESCHCSYK